MKSIQIHDPAMCCSSGVYRPDVDPVLPRFAGLLAQLGGPGVKVERYNLAQQPLAFVQNPAVKALLGGIGILTKTDTAPSAAGEACCCGTAGCC